MIIPAHFSFHFFLFFFWEQHINKMSGALPIQSSVNPFFLRSKLVARFPVSPGRTEKMQKKKQYEKTTKQQPSLPVKSAPAGFLWGQDSSDGCPWRWSHFWVSHPLGGSLCWWVLQPVSTPVLDNHKVWPHAHEETTTQYKLHMHQRLGWDFTSMLALQTFQGSMHHCFGSD